MAQAMQVTESSWNRELRKVRRLRQAHARQQDKMLICSLKERVLHLELELQQKALSCPSTRDLNPKPPF